MYGIKWTITRYDEPNSAGMDGHLGDTSTARSYMLTDADFEYLRDVMPLAEFERMLCSLARDSSAKFTREELDDLRAAVGGEPFQAAPAFKCVL